MTHSYNKRNLPARIKISGNVCESSILLNNQPTVKAKDASPIVDLEVKDVSQIVDLEAEAFSS